MKASDQSLHANKMEVLAKIGLILDDYQARGFYGEVRLDLEIKAGVVKFIRKTGEQETVRIGD